MTLLRPNRKVYLLALCLWVVLLLAACQPAPLASAASRVGPSIISTQPVTAATCSSLSLAVNRPQMTAPRGQVKQASLQFREETPIPRLLSDSHPFEEELLGLINKEREKAGVAPLAHAHLLASLAREHCQAMGEHHFFSHNSLDGQTFEGRLKQAGYIYSAAAENIFAGNGPYNTPEAALRAWMNSPAHRANLLNPVYVEVGIGYRYLPDSPYGGYFTADFGAP